MGSRHVVHHLEHVMGTVVTIDIYSQFDGPSDGVRHEVEEAVNLLHLADTVFSTWNADSPMSRLRRGEIILAQAPSEMAEVLEACAIAREFSDGWFDPWSMPGGVDPTGYVKGWAAQRALGVLQSNDIVGAMVNAAGDIASRGGMSQSIPFRVGISDPHQPTQLACVVELTGAIATSGTYERGAHLIDPQSGLPAARVASATVTGPELGLADALATAVAVAGDSGLKFVQAIENYEALIIDLEGCLRWTDHFPFAPPSTAQQSC